MGAEADLVIVVGSKNSSNSVRLVEVAHARRRPRRPTSWTSPSEIDEAWLEGVTTVGVTSGASVPEVLVEEVLEWLAAARLRGRRRSSRRPRSRITFSLPKELRRDLRAEAAALVAGARRDGRRHRLGRVTVSRTP